MQNLRKQAGLDGVVCSTHEVQKIHEVISHEFLTVTLVFVMRQVIHMIKRGLRHQNKQGSLALTSSSLDVLLQKQTNPLEAYLTMKNSLGGILFNVKKKIAEHLLEIKAVYLQPNDPFTWSSGMKSPIYCDNRLTLSYPDIRQEIAEGLQQLIEEHFPETELIAGTATAGIPHAAWVSDLIEFTNVLCSFKSKRAW